MGRGSLLWKEGPEITTIWKLVVISFYVCNLLGWFSRKAWIE